MTAVTRKLRWAAAVALVTLPAFYARAQPNEPEDAQEQAEITAGVDENSPGFVPYHPDPRLSDKAAGTQPLFDYFNAATSAVPCNLPHYTKSMPDRIWDKLYERIRALFPDGRDDAIAFDHLGKHAAPHTVDCSILQVRLEQLKAETRFSE
jgi:hypothetical protein